jgi:hypothetical protein
MWRDDAIDRGKVEHVISLADLPRELPCLCALLHRYPPPSWPALLYVHSDGGCVRVLVTHDAPHSCDAPAPAPAPAPASTPFMRRRSAQERRRGVRSSRFGSL